MRSKKIGLIALCIVCICFSTNTSAFMANCSDSLSIMPGPVFGLEENSLRYGLRFSVIKTLIHLPAPINPYLETGITLFDTIDASPDDKKHIHLKGGLLFDLKILALSVETGMLYGNKKLGLTSGIGIWKFFSFSKYMKNKTIKDFPSYHAYVVWRNNRNRERKKLFKGCSISLRLSYNFQIEPALTSGIFFDLYL